MTHLGPVASPRLRSLAYAAVALIGLRPIGVSANDARLKVLMFDPTAIITLTAFVGYHVHLEFAADEHFLGLGAGDTSVIDVGAEGNHLLLKPRSPNAGTNLTILTNRRAYYLDYRALARAPHPEEATYSIAFRYPDTLPAPVPVAEQSPGGAHLDATPPAPNRDYWYCGSPAIRPVSAADDGLQLQLVFGPHAELPTIYVLGGDGAETLVNTHVEHDTIFVHRLASHLVLRRGKLVGCVVDHNSHVQARRAASGTVDAATQRVLQTEKP